MYTLPTVALVRLGYTIAKSKQPQHTIVFIFISWFLYIIILFIINNDSISVIYYNQLSSRAGKSGAREDRLVMQGICKMPDHLYAYAALDSLLFYDLSFVQVCFKNECVKNKFW